MSIGDTFAGDMTSISPYLEVEHDRSTTVPVFFGE
jgi:hypothetical protein